MNKIHAMEEKRSADTPVRESAERGVEKGGQECPHTAAALKLYFVPSHST